MATFQSDIANDPPRTPRYGSLIARKATFTVPAGFTQAEDDIDLFTIPKGAQIVDMTVTQSGTGRTADVGDAADDDRFIAAAADNVMTRISLAAGINFQFTADTVLKAVFNTGNPTATGVVTVRCSYLLSP